MRRRGLTILEMLVTLGLVFVVLGVVGDLFREYSMVTRAASVRERVTESAQIALDRVRLEYREAVERLSPADGSSGWVSELRFRKPHPDDDLRFPSALPTPLPSSWVPIPERIEVAYYADNANFYRKITVGGQTTEQLLATGISGFSCRNLGEGELEIILSVTQKGRVISLQTRSLRMLP